MTPPRPARASRTRYSGIPLNETDSHHPDESRCEESIRLIHVVQGVEQFRGSERIQTSRVATMKPIGLGTSSLGGLFAEMTDSAARATVDHAWEVGIRHFDTAPLYGSGVSERRLGEALRTRPRDEFILSTKVGRILRPGEPDSLFVGAPRLAAVADYSAAGMLGSLHESLERLGLDRVDIALVHDPEDHLEEALAGTQTVRRVVAQVGVGTNFVATAKAFVGAGLVDVVLLAGRYTLLDRSAEDFLSMAADRGVEVVAAGIYNSGILAGGTTFDYRTAKPDIVARVASIRDACNRHAIPMRAAAIQFVLRHPGVTRIVVGAKSAAEVEENIRLASVAIPDAFWHEEAIVQPNYESVRNI